MSLGEGDLTRRGVDATGGGIRSQLDTLAANIASEVRPIARLSPEITALVIGSVNTVLETPESELEDLMRQVDATASTDPWGILDTTRRGTIEASLAARITKDTTAFKGILTPAQIKTSNIDFFQKLIAVRSVRMGVASTLGYEPGNEPAVTFHPDFAAAEDLTRRLFDAARPNPQTRR